MQKALCAVSTPGIPTLLFGALPCTGGSPYQFLNWHLGPKTRAKIRHRRALFRVLWRNFVVVADACRANGGQVAFEWPRGCTYWREVKVKSFLKRSAMQTYAFDGCMYGLRSQRPRAEGKLLRKPWCIAATSDAFQRLCRKCCHDPKQHAKVEGSDTKLTESYTDELAHGIISCSISALTGDATTTA